MGTVPWGRGWDIRTWYPPVTRPILGWPIFMEFFAQDRRTRVITGFVEALRDPEKFLRAVDEAHAHGKAVVL